MTEHGFCKGTIYSEKPPPPEIIAEIVAKVSQVKGIIWAHVVKSAETERSEDDIIFEFGHPSKYGWNNLGELLQTICNITIDDHRIGTPIDVWIIQSSYKDGKPAEKI